MFLLTVLSGLILQDFDGPFGNVLVC